MTKTVAAADSFPKRRRNKYLLELFAIKKKRRRQKRIFELRMK
jgi:hypothetical protein